MSQKLSRRSFVTATTATAALVVSKKSAAKLTPPYPIGNEPLTREDYALLKKKTAEIYKKNEVTIAAGTFHVPAHGKYDSLFSWDSGWQAIAMTRFDPALAASEMNALFSLQLDNGRISHDTHFPELQKKANTWSKLGTSLGKSQFDDKGRSAMIDPPAFIIACEKIYAQTQDRAWLDAILPKLERCLHYLTHDRDLFGDGLVAVIHPWETGTDSSPAYDEIVHLDFRTPLGAPTRGLLYPRMLDDNAKFGWDPQEAKKHNRFVLEDLTFNSITMRALQAVASLQDSIGNRERAEQLRAQARSMMAAIDRINWVEAKGCYYSRYDVKNPKLAMRTTCASLLPLLTGLVSKERAERVIREYALNPNRFWLDYVFTFNPKDEMEHDKVYMEDLLLWRGHCIWTNMNWMMVEALLNYGYQEEARELTRRTARMILHEGLWEFYDFRNGQGKGQPNFNWPGLALDMINRTWPETV
jgi:glycogen debranching enzyme